MSNFDKLTNCRQRQVMANGQGGEASNDRSAPADRLRVTIPTKRNKEEETTRRRQLCWACEIWHELFGRKFVTFDFWPGVNVSQSSSNNNNNRVQQIFCAIFCTLKVNVFLASQNQRQTDRKKESLQRIAWLSLAFCFWHAIERHLAHAAGTAPPLRICSLHSLCAPQMLFTSPRITYTPRAASVTATCWDSFAQATSRLLTHTHNEAKYKYVYVIQAARVCLIKPANSASLGDLLECASLCS